MLLWEFPARDMGLEAPGSPARFLDLDKISVVIMSSAMSISLEEFAPKSFFVRAGKVYSSMDLHECGA